MFVTSKRYRRLEEDFRRLLRKEQATFLEKVRLEVEVEKLKAENGRLEAENRIHRKDMWLMAQIDRILGRGTK